MVKPTADVSIAIGAARYTGSVDANCTQDEKATPTNGRFYYHIMYPWFGARAAAGQPQWRFSLDLSRPTRPAAFEYFVFSFLDGSTARRFPRARAPAARGTRARPLAWLRSAA